MARLILFLVLLLPLSLLAQFKAETVNASLGSIGCEETLAQSEKLASLLERYDSHTPLLYRRYQATPEEFSRIEAKFTEAGIPLFFALIPYSESRFNPSARGYGTAGLWQFTKQSARNFGLTVKKGNDERLNADRSTDAAIRYIKSLKKEFGSWYLADFAYGMGEGKLNQLIQKNGSKKLSVLLKDPHFPIGTKAHFATVLLLDARVRQSRTASGSDE